MIMHLSLSRVTEYGEFIETRKVLIHSISLSFKSKEKNHIAEQGLVLMNLERTTQASGCFRSLPYKHSTTELKVSWSHLNTFSEKHKLQALKSWRMWIDMGLDI